MRVRRVHRWDVSPAEAVEIQKRLAPAAVAEDRFDPCSVTSVAGVDVSYSKGDRRFFACVVVAAFPGMEVLEARYAAGEAAFPYVPGLLVFREGPTVTKVLEAVEREPDVIVFDGHGVSHPRGIGIATHMGILLGKPTIGCAKRKLVGEYEEPPRAEGAAAPLTWRGREVGTALRTRAGAAPVFVSAGHMISLSTAARLVMESVRGRRLPEPTRLAHVYSNRFRRGERIL
ncbi:MAG: endonuclease V [bacterium]